LKSFAYLIGGYLGAMIFAYDVGMRQSGDNWGVQGYCDATFIDMQGAAVLLKAN
jgi:hypothetical protein